MILSWDFLRFSLFISALKRALLFSKSNKWGEFMMIFIIGRSKRETDWSYFFLFKIVESFLLMVEFRSKRPFGLHTLSFQSLLNAAFWIKNMSDDTDEFYSFFADDDLCFSLIYPSEAILFASFYSCTVLSSSPFLLSNSILILKTTKKISKISGMFLIN